LRPRVARVDYRHSHGGDRRFFPFAAIDCVAPWTNAIKSERQVEALKTQHMSAEAALAQAQRNFTRRGVNLQRQRARIRSRSAGGPDGARSAVSRAGGEDRGQVSLDKPSACSLVL
jgi:hypothetical protein